MLSSENIYSLDLFGVSSVCTTTVCFFDDTVPCGIAAKALERVIKRFESSNVMTRVKENE